VAERGSRAKNITIRGGVVPLALVCFRDVTLSDIELFSQARRKRRLPKQYRIQFSVRDTLRSTKNARKKANQISWDDVLYLWVHMHCFTPSN
jgi:hypothetical protein